jgi:UDP-N-acetylmuramoyl-tripeptide--D-alanyl-D-alanine ligase
MTPLLRADLLSIFLAICLIALNAQARASSDRINLAVEHMGRMQQESGSFRYQFDFLSGRWSDDNNIVRQAGAGYALGEYLLMRKNPETKKQLRRAILWYSKSSMEWKGGKLLTFDGNYKQAKAGATALALLSALYYRKATGDKLFDPDIRTWVDGLLALRNKNAGFSRRPRKRKESPYSNGEIWLALSVYSQQFPKDTRVLNTLDQIDGYFLKHYSENPDIGFFHWGLMAASERYKQTKRKRLLDFAIQQTNQYLTEMRPRISANSNSCYSVEGMTAVLGMLESKSEHAELKGRLETRIGKEMDKNLALQIMPGQKQITFGPERTLSAPEIANNSGAFLNGRLRPQIRIDATQHCLSAMLRAQALNLP